MSNSNADAITALQAQIATMALKLEDLQREQPIIDPQLHTPPSVQIFTPSDEEQSRYPPIKPSDPNSFFTQDIPDEEFWEQLRRYPKNSAMGYEPPKIPAVIQLSTSAKNHDNHLKAIQKRLVNITRPIDLFLHQIWSMENQDSLDAEEVVKLCSNFATLIRDQIAATSGKVNSIRLESLRSSRGVNYKQDGLDIVDPSKFQEEIKSTRSLVN
jgi:hypothetical protein